MHRVKSPKREGQVAKQTDQMIDPVTITVSSSRKVIKFSNKVSE